MPDLKTVGVKELKDRLSLYLREVKTGSRILVTEHGKVIAELRDPSSGILDNHEESSLISEWLREKKLRPAIAKKKKCPESPVHLTEGTAQTLLDQERNS